MLLIFYCHRTAIIGATVASTVAVVTAVMVGITVLRYKRKLKRKEGRMASIVANLNQGNGFAVYLIYSSVDEVFVRSAVFSPLNDKLKQVTGVGRDLVSIGDEQFRVGWNIYREIFMELSNVAVVVLSEGFANSVFCDQEIDIAMQLKKPVILLLKGDVDINQHSELIQLLFQTNVLFLFGYVDNEVVLKTTWNKVLELSTLIVKSLGELTIFSLCLKFDFCTLLYNTVFPPFKINFIKHALNIYTLREFAGVKF
ncbi:hypothetical protein DPMN_148752 [Dreissena polymorpha]|uniref:TIR domain-containing protein n=1 Tax=Dreissena polymorpha TaxID=45954 RepID=A0A9D4FA76_DREPO|nr:hypothetical protein DPMN_148752 [Dreissena polymorpha]